MPSIIQTFIRTAGASLYSEFESVAGVCFSIMFISALFVDTWSIVPSAAKRDLGTSENAYTPTASLMSISGRDLHTIIIRAKRHLSSLSGFSRQ